MKTKIPSFILVILAVFFLLPNSSFAAPCYSNIGTFVATTKSDGTCPTGTYLTDPCSVKPVPGCYNYVQPPKATINPVITPVSPAPSGPGYNLTPPNTTGGVTNPIQNAGTAPITNGLIPCDNVTVKCDFNAFAAMINRIIDWFLGISVTVATITFTIAGAKILMNPESDSERQAAKEMFTKTVWGLLIILTAWLVVDTIISTLVNPDVGALRFFK